MPLGHALRRTWPHAALWDGYGLTETNTFDFFLPADEYDQGAGTIGRPAPGIAYRLATPDSELQIKTPTIMRGYLDDTDQTAAAFADGWFRTGDLAQVRADGRVALKGRAKEIINRAGNKVSPLEVEAVFLEHPDVGAALVAGAQDEKRGEAIHLCVVPRPGAELDLTGLRNWARTRARSLQAAGSPAPARGTSSRAHRQGGPPRTPPNDRTPGRDTGRDCGEKSGLDFPHP